MFVRSALLFIPVFLVWNLLLSLFILPIVAETTDYTIKVLFSEIKPQLLYQEKEQTWQLKTLLFNASTPYANNTYKPNLILNGTTILNIGQLGAFTLGLPLFWLLILLVSAHKRKHIVQGSAILIVVICLNTVLLVVHEIISALQSSPLLRIYSESYIKVPSAPPVWLIDVIKPLLDTFVIMNILIIPVWLAYHYYSKQSVGGMRGTK
jgi:hypothetical protein